MSNFLIYVYSKTSIEWTVQFCFKKTILLRLIKDIHKIAEDNIFVKLLVCKYCTESYTAVIVDYILE